MRPSSDSSVDSLATGLGAMSPTMGTIASNAAIAREAGYQVLETFAQPASAWWDDFYRPLRGRIAALRAEAEADPALSEAIASTVKEIELYERYGDHYGYVFYLLRRL